MNGKIKELVEELRQVFWQKYKLIDFLLPPLVFWLAVKFFDFQLSLMVSVVCIFLLLVWRLKKKESLIFIFFGLVGVISAFIFAWQTGSSAGFFLPDVSTDGILALLCLFSILVGKPLVAYTSMVSRRWPAAWYWHPQVKPAYREVTVLWTLFFGFKFALGYWLLARRQAENLALVNLTTGWPAVVLLLIISYLYGLRRLRTLKGPSVKEFKKEKKPPWQGQKRGF